MTKTHSGTQSAIVHALGWMAFANLVGVWMSLLLLWPSLGQMTQELTYGKWNSVHLNAHLYGWCSLPLIAFLFGVFKIEQNPLKKHARVFVWLWTLALAVGCISWLMGNSSGKIFLDWKGFPLFLFVGTLSALWLYLSAITWINRHESKLWWRVVTLAVLLPVPFLIWFAADPSVYPPVNPDTGGPTGSSLLGSSLSIIILMLFSPTVIGWKKRDSSKRLQITCWCVLALQIALLLTMKQGASSHHEMEQFLGLGSLLLWFPLMPLYMRLWTWSVGMQRWMLASCAWLGLLILTGWMSFLPGWLDKMKFTNGLVAHSHLAMAGFVTSFLMLLSGESLSKPCRKGLTASLPFFSWHIAVGIYLIAMWWSSYLEAANPGYIVAQSSPVLLPYLVRSCCGIVMLIVSFTWWRGLLPSLSHE